MFQRQIFLEKIQHLLVFEMTIREKEGDYRQSSELIINQK